MAAKKKGAPRKRPSGPSGLNTKPGILLRASPEEFEAWRAAASTRGGLTHWIRGACYVAACKAGFDPDALPHVRRNWPKKPTT